MKVGFVGLGTMGLPMAINLIKSGFDVVVYNRTEERTQAVREIGGQVVYTPSDARQTLMSS